MFLELGAPVASAAASTGWKSEEGCEVEEGCEEIPGADSHWGSTTLTRRQRLSVSQPHAWVTNGSRKLMTQPTRRRHRRDSVARVIPNYIYLYLSIYIAAGSNTRCRHLITAWCDYIATRTHVLQHHVFRHR